MTAEHPRARAPRWVGVHLYYHDPLDQLLRGAVRPLLDELATGGLSDGFFFIRYWQGGPHVRLRVLLPGRAEPGPVKQLIEARIGDFFTRHPSRAALDPENYRQTAGRLARHEFGHDRTPIEPLRPNNSLRHAAYLPEGDRLGGAAGVRAFEPHFMDSSELALEIIATTPSRERCAGRALAMMLLAAAVFLPDPRPLARFFRYAYRDWATRNAKGDLDRYARREAEFAGRYARQETQLRNLAVRLLDQTLTSSGDQLDPTSARWMASVTALRERLTGQPLKTESGLFQCIHKHNNRVGIGTAEETYLLFLLQRALTEIIGG